GVGGGLGGEGVAGEQERADGGAQHEMVFHSFFSPCRRGETSIWGARLTVVDDGAATILCRLSDSGATKP
uniref:hypothetical protein n=1 Tax=uncultured Caulobacter sp. TaxID=158749 RepID=UPI0025D65720